ncbi:MAG: hypothetical protein HOP11_05700 [Saprospiraceae bacterium]|nr:hypothetical protein [Saprospiraceae bacterium]
MSRLTNKIKWMHTILYIFIGIAGLNIFNDYSSPYDYYPGDGSVASTRPIRTPGDGSVASTRPIRPPGDGSVASTRPIRPPGGPDLTFQPIIEFNYFYVALVVFGAIIGGIFGREYLDSSFHFGPIICAFIFSRAFLYIGIFIYHQI